MNDLGIDGEIAVAAAQYVPMQAGTMLKDAREAQGLHIAALAVALKVPVRKLEALEAGQFDQLPDMVFVRSLALSVCRALKIDPSPIMSSLPAPQFNQFKINEPGLNTTFKDSPGTSRQGLLAQLSSPIGLGVLFLVVAIAAILVWPVKPLFDDKPQASNEAAEPVVAMEQPVPASASASAVVDDGVGLAPSTTQQVAPVVVDSPTAAVSKEVSGAPSNPASSPGSVYNTEVPSQSALLELSGHGESWVQVTDGAGQPKLRKLIQNGEVIRVTGQLPLSVVVGRAENVSVTVRGKPMDLTPLARENVARFEVK
jgi:cytoskeleton protein RodZ